MLKNLFLCLTLTIFFGCSNILPSALPEYENNSAFSDNENELFGIGSSKISSSGDLIASEKSSREAKEQLKKKILVEENIIFKSFLTAADPNTKKIILPAIPDLIDYTASQLVQQSNKKDSWIVENIYFSSYSITRSEIYTESENVFIMYLEDVIKKFLDIKEDIKNK